MGLSEENQLNLPFPPMVKTPESSEKQSVEFAVSTNGENARIK